VRWREQSWTMNAVRSGSLPLPAASRYSLARLLHRLAGRSCCFSLIHGGAKQPAANTSSPLQRIKLRHLRRAFTVLEMLVVITIIGLMAAIALPHLPGMTRANSMTTALQQMLGDCALARQLAMSHRSTVYMVFVPPYSAAWPAAPGNEGNSYTNLLAHQYSAYALVSLRSVGDQPGMATPQYLTEWKALPDGVFVAPWKFTNTSSLTVCSTNTLTGVIVTNNVNPFPTGIPFLFPSVDAAPCTMLLPYIGFNALGQLTTNNDEYIPLSRGSVFYPVGSGATPAMANEAPPGNAVNNCNLIHLDWLTARAKIERNQQR